MRMNVAAVAPRTHEGGPAITVSPIEQLKRTLLACLLWEDGAYESGQTAVDRIKALVPQCAPDEVAALAVEARDKQRLRHAPLMLVRELARHPRRAEMKTTTVAKTLAHVIQRADELAEFLAMYWSEGKKPLSKQVKVGLAHAFRKFDAYQLAKYNRDNAIKLRDVLFMVHAVPLNETQAAAWKQLVDGTLPAPDTWEVALSAGADKRESFERLLRDGKLGYVALLRNLRNMQQAGVDEALVFEQLRAGAAKSKALPFRFVAAARAVPAWEQQIDAAMLIAMADMERLPGRTVVLVDVSGSMDVPLSSKSDLTRADAAAALAVLVRGISESCRVFSFSSSLVEVPPRSGMALVDAVLRSQPHGSTYLGRAIEAARRLEPGADRLIVITDEQSADAVGAPVGRGYMVNVAGHQNGVGYGPWTRITGWSESIVRFIQELEKR